jgi:hypothetical protein
MRKWINAFAVQLFSAFAFAFLPLAELSTAFAGTAATIHPGYYVGPGDDATVVLHVLPNGTAVLGALNTYGGAGWHPSPITTAKLITIGNPRTPGAFKGSLEKMKGGKYLFQLGTPAHKSSFCQYVIANKANKPGDISFQRKPNSGMGCMYYHNASWGYRAVIKHRVLVLWALKGH